ncbi:MAG: DUF349 domain-containing protein [Pseudomonadota bacterium]
MFKHFFRPKWLHPDAAARRQAVDALGPEQVDVAKNLVFDDQDPGVRRAACKHLSDLTVLQRILEEDGDAGVREMATARFRQVMTGQGDTPPPLAERLTWLATRDGELLEHLAREAREPAMRLAAIERLEQPSVLGECAIQDIVAANRQAAALRIHDKAILERLAQASRKRDKGVYRVAKDRLKTLGEQATLPVRQRAEAESLCERAERLGHAHAWSQDKALLDHLQALWERLDPQCCEPLKPCFEAHCQRFLLSYTAYCDATTAQRAEQDARHALHQTRRLLVESLEHLQKDPPASVDDMVNQLEAIKDQWQGLAERRIGDDRTLEQAFWSHWEDAQRQLDILRGLASRYAAARHLLDDTETWLEGPVPIPPTAFADFERTWQALAPHPEDLSARHLVIHQRLSDRRAADRELLDQRLDQAKTTLQSLQSAIESGTLKTASPLHQRLLADLEWLHQAGAPGRALNPLVDALDHLAPEIRQLEDWRQWSGDQHRLALLERMEALAGEDAPLENLATQLKALQQEWKALDQTGATGKRGLWERFHRTSRTVYDRCRPFFEQQSQRREEAAQQLEALCEALETLAAELEGGSADWRSIQQRLKKLRQQWLTREFPDRERRRTLDRRFHQAIRQVEGRLDAERRVNQALKHQLVGEVTALIEHPDIDHAIRETKQCQRAWVTTVAGRRSEENRLWQEFRAACDQVFARREAVLQAEHQQRAEVIARLEGLCLDLEKLAGNPESLDRDPLQRQVAELDAQWRASPLADLPPPNREALANRWRSAREAFKTRLRRLESDKEGRIVEQMALRTALCTRMESLANREGDGGTDREEEILMQQWRSLPALGDEVAAGVLDRRFASARAALIEGGEALARLRERFSANLAERQRLCLDAELLAGLESPPEMAGARLAHQVERLNQAIREGDRGSNRQRLLQRWYLAGPVDPTAEVALTRRFEAVLAALAVRPEERQRDG